MTTYIETIWIHNGLSLWIKVSNRKPVYLSGRCPSRLTLSAGRALAQSPLELVVLCALGADAGVCAQLAVGHAGLAGVQVPVGVEPPRAVETTAHLVEEPLRAIFICEWVADTKLEVSVHRLAVVPHFCKSTPPFSTPRTHRLFPCLKFHLNILFTICIFKFLFLRARRSNFRGGRWFLAEPVLA